jgi:hypothetical protein
MAAPHSLKTQFLVLTPPGDRKVLSVFSFTRHALVAVVHVTCIGPGKHVRIKSGSTRIGLFVGELCPIPACMSSASAA